MITPPPVLPEETKRNEDQLKLLGIFHYVFAGLSVFGLGFLFLHRAMLHFFLGNPALWKDASPNPAPAILSLFNLFYLVIGIFIAAAGCANFISGWSIHRRTRRMFSLVVAGLNCLQFPFGTALGVFTFVVLSRDSVRDAYRQKAEPDPSVFFRRLNVRAKRIDQRAAPCVNDNRRHSRNSCKQSATITR